MSPEAMLERRYRRLLRLYPRAHRIEYEEEMVGVLLADATPGRRRPGPHEVLDLVLSALTVRWLRRSGALRDENWRQAARAAQVFGVMLLLAVDLRRVAEQEAAALRYSAWTPHAAVDLRPMAWAVVLVLALAGWRWTAVPAALVGLVAEALPPIGLYQDTPARLLNAYWILVAAAVVAGVSLMTALRARVLPSDAGRLPPGTALGALGGGLIVLVGAGDVLLAEPFPEGDGSNPLLGGRFVSYPALVLYAVAVLLVLWGVFRLSRPVIRRLVVLAVPIVVSWPLIPVGFGDLIEHNVRSPQSTQLLGPLQWAALVIVPLAAMRVAATLNRRLEQGRAGSSSV